MTGDIIGINTALDTLEDDSLHWLLIHQSLKGGLDKNQMFSRRIITLPRYTVYTKHTLQRVHVNG